MSEVEVVEVREFLTVLEGSHGFEEAFSLLLVDALDVLLADLDSELFAPAIEGLLHQH